MSWCSPLCLLLLLGIASCRHDQPAPSRSASSSPAPRPSSTPAAGVALALIPPADLTQLSPADFADNELDLPYYLVHFSTLANAIQSEGPQRGQIKLSVWRGSDHAHNARVMENVLSLAWFYTQKRKWNPYYASPALRRRIEAALGFWSRLQGPDGQFTEYEPGVYGLAPTAFATKFFGEALLLLRSGPPLDQPVLARAVQTLENAVRVTLNHPGLYATGRSYTNQYGNVWGGGLALLSFRPNAPLKNAWERRFLESLADFQSPAGFYYESDGPDFEYTLNTHHHSVRQAWEWLRGTPLGSQLLEHEIRFVDWLALNAVPEPGRGFALNSAIATRKALTAFESYNTPFAEISAPARAFAESSEELSARTRTTRAALVQQWPHVPPLHIGEFSAYSPYAFLHRRRTEWRPSTTERDAARAQLPVIAKNRFTVQRHDKRVDATFTFIRRPTYYAALATGERAAEQQRYGLGLLWSPKLGVLLLSQPAGAWGTRAGKSGVYEAGAVHATLKAGSVEVSPAPPGSRDLQEGRLTARYRLGAVGQKTLDFADGEVRISVQHPDEFEEVIPLFIPPDGHLVVSAGRVTINSPAGAFDVIFDKRAKPSTRNGAVTVFGKRLTILTLSVRDRLNYALRSR